MVFEEREVLLLLSFLLSMMYVRFILGNAFTVFVKPNKDIRNRTDRATVLLTMTHNYYGRLNQGHNCKLKNILILKLDNFMFFIFLIFKNSTSPVIMM